MGILQQLWKRREIVPLIAFTSFAGMWCTYSLWHASQKSDVMFRRTGNPEPWQHVNPNIPQKLYTINQQWKPIEEVEKIRKLTK